MIVTWKKILILETHQNQKTFFSQVCTKLIAFRGTTPEQSKELAKKRLQAQKD